ncbi:Uncharacterised protein [Leminorella grimontii]|nr:acyltransferase [Leminorella grimontii ATCC 33999 = DSM 5078]VFS62219.1 Uncharacterised protein [Leminorella grimontii]
MRMENNNIMRLHSVKLWCRFTIFLGVVAALSIIFFKYYRRYGIEYVSNIYGRKHENAGIILYGTSSIFMTLLCIALLSLAFLFIYVSLFKKSRLASQLIFTGGIFISLSVFSALFAPPTANFEMKVYHNDLTYSEYVWAWPREGGEVTVLPMSNFKGYQEEQSLYVRGETEFLTCISHYYEWYGSIQVKKELWPLYIYAIPSKADGLRFCHVLSKDEVNKLSESDKKEALRYWVESDDIWR